MCFGDFVGKRTLCDAYHNGACISLTCISGHSESELFHEYMNTNTISTFEKDFHTREAVSHFSSFRILEFGMIEDEAQTSHS